MVVISPPGNSAISLSVLTTSWCSPSAHATLSSGVLKLLGRALSTALGSLLRERISSMRPAVYIASSKPYQRSLKKMCPESSPASGAPVSLSLAFASEWPVIHIVGLPPCWRIHGARRWLHFTSKMISPPGTRSRTSAASSMIWRSGMIISPSLVTTPSRSPSPSKARPSSAPQAWTMLLRSSRFSGRDGSGWWLGKSPSTFEKMSITSQPRARRMAGAEAPGMPLPLSTTIFIGRASLQSLTMRCVYSATTSILPTRPLPAM